MGEEEKNQTTTFRECKLYKKIQKCLKLQYYN